MLFKSVARAAIAFILITLGPVAAAAHIMVAQHGTLNFTDKGIYLVISLPVSAFRGVDENGDGQWTSRELALHEKEARAQVRNGLILQHGNKALPLEGLVLNLSFPHGNQDRAQHVIVMGRYKTPRGTHPLTLRLDLLGTGSEEGSMTLQLRKGKRVQRQTITKGKSVRLASMSGS